MIERVKGTNWFDVCFEECEIMWKSVSEQYVRENCKCFIEVCYLKTRWLNNNGYGDRLPVHNCLFCEYTVRNDDMDCARCPGKAVDESFLCSNLDYHYCLCKTLFAYSLLLYHHQHMLHTQDKLRISSSK